MNELENIQIELHRRSIDPYFRDKKVFWYDIFDQNIHGWQPPETKWSASSMSGIPGTLYDRADAGASTIVNRVIAALAAGHRGMIIIVNVGGDSQESSHGTDPWTQYQHRAPPSSIEVGPAWLVDWEQAVVRAGEESSWM